MVAAAGQNRFGPYIVQEKLGGGGMAVVYRALREDTGATVALKILRASLAEQPAVVERFRQEAEIARRLHHPHIVTVNSFGAFRGRYFLEMEYLPGGTLAARFSAPADIHAQEVVRLLRGVAGALDYAHHQGVIHRDIKLENILLNKRGDAALSDFGIARILDADGTRLTVTGGVVGTPLYLSPEQARGASDLDFRSDLYSMGVIAYALAVGRFPFNGSTPLAILHQHVAEPPPLPSSLNPALPKSLDPVLLKSLSKHPSDRYGSADTFVEAFARACADEVIQQTHIDLWSDHVGVARPAPVVAVSHTESADSLYQKAAAIAPSNRDEAIRLLKLALELEPLHSKANRLHFQLEGAKPFVQEARTPPQQARSSEDLEPLKKVKKQKQRSLWSNVGCLAGILLSLTSLFFVLSFTGSPIAGVIANMLQGRRAVTDIQGTPVRDIPNVVLTVEPAQSKPMMMNDQLGDTLDNGIEHEYSFRAERGTEVVVGLWFLSPTANKVAKNVAVIAPDGSDWSSLCQRDRIMAAEDTNVAFTCQINQSGIWKLRIFGIDGESTGAYFVSVTKM
jgi:serine/threonine protein kinase